MHACVPTQVTDVVDVLDYKPTIGIEHPPYPTPEEAPRIEVGRDGAYSHA